MNRHYRKGFQTTFINDTYMVQERLQEYDKDLYVMYNTKTDEHLIMDGLTGLAVMKIPQKGFPALTGHVVDHIKKIHAINGFNAFDEVEKARLKREQDEEKRIADLSRDIAKESKEAFDNAYNYGRTGGVQKYFGGVANGP